MQRWWTLILGIGLIEKGGNRFKGVQGALSTCGPVCQQMIRGKFDYIQQLELENLYISLKGWHSSVKLSEYITDLEN